MYFCLNNGLLFCTLLISVLLYNYYLGFIICCASVLLVAMAVLNLEFCVVPKNTATHSADYMLVCVRACVRACVFVCV